MAQSALEVVKQHRLAWSSAILVALVLIFFMHAPVLPVIAGCLIGVGLAALRSSSRREAASRIRTER